MTATTLPATALTTASAAGRHAPVAASEASASLPHRAGASLPPALRTLGALAALVLAVVLTGFVLVGAAIVLPFGLVAAALTRRRPQRGQAARRQGWRPALA